MEGKNENLFKSSFFRKLFFSYALLILVSIVLFFVWYLSSYRENARAEAREHARQQATAFATYTDQKLLTAQSLTGAVNASESLRGMYQTILIEKKTPDSLQLYRAQSELSRIKASSANLEVYAILLGFEQDMRLYAPGQVIVLNDPVQNLSVTPWIEITNGVTLLRLRGVSNLMLNKEFLIYADAYTGGASHGGARGLAMVLIDPEPLKDRIAELQNLLSFTEISNGAKVVFTSGTAGEADAETIEIHSLVCRDLSYRFEISPEALNVSPPLKALVPLLVTALGGAVFLYLCYRYLRYRYAPIGAITEMVATEKQTGGGDLDEVLKGISDLIGERNGYREKMITVSPYASHGVLHQLISGNMDNAQLSALQEEQFWLLRWEFYMVGLVNLAPADGKQVTEQQYLDARALAAHACSALSDEEHSVVTCPKDARNLYVVANGDRAEELSELFYTMLRRIEEAVDSPALAVTVGVSAPETEPDKLRSACLEASAALENMITGGRGSVYFSEKEQAPQDREYWFPKDAQTRMVKGLSENNREELESLMSQLWDKNIKRAALSPKAVRQLADELHTCVSGALRQISEKSTTHLRVERVAEPATIEEIFAYYRGILSQALVTYRTEVANDETGEKLQREICEYIDANVLNPDLSLTAVADHFGVSGKLVGNVCKNTYGKTYLQYVRDSQIQHAAELLQTTDLPLEEIAERCGFTNLLTFRRNFKATMNINPSDYRKT